MSVETEQTGATEPEKPAALKSPFGAWWMLAILVFLYILSIIDRNIVAMLVDSIKADLGIGDFQISLILGPAFALFYSVAGFPFGWASDRFPRRYVIFVGSVFWSVATICCGFAGGFFSLFLARAFVGAGEASLTPAAYSLMSDKFPRKRLTTALSIYASAPQFGQAIAFGVGAYVIDALTRLQGAGDLPFEFLAATAPWRIVFYSLGVFGVFATFIVFAFKEPARTGLVKAVAVKDRAQQITLLNYFRHYPTLIICLVIGFGLVGMCMGAMVMWVPSHMVRAFGWTPLQYGPAIGAISICAAICVMAKGVLIDWLYGRGMRDAHIRFYTWLLIGFFPVLVTVFFVTDPWLFIVLYGIVQAIVLPFMLYISATIPMIAPNEVRGRLAAFFLFLVSIIGMGIGPTIVGFLTDFVFRDPARLGTSMACLLIVTAVVSTVCLRIALVKLKKPLADMEALEAAG